MHKLQKTGIILVGLFFLFIQVSATELNEANVIIDTPGSPYWIINTPGDYLLTYSPVTINTNSNYAILVRASDVSIDLNGKTITGTVVPDISQPTMVDVLNRTNPSYYGVWAWRVNNFTVRNGTISNKVLGILYEETNFGGVRNLHILQTGQGITVWNCTNILINSNRIESSRDGIVLDAIRTRNEFFTIEGNIINIGWNSGIILWLNNSHNIIKNNYISGGNVGIDLSDGGTTQGGQNNSLLSNTINSCTFGIDIRGFRTTTINNNTITGVATGTWFNSANNNKFMNNRINDTIIRGIYLYSSSNSNFFYNNYFRNGQNVLADGTSTSNFWNISPVPGTNIVQGRFLGGNYWSNPAGMGFSDTCADTNADRICDTAYSPSAGMTDYFPLARPGPLPLVKDSIGVFRPSVHLFYEDVNGNGIWNGGAIDRYFSFGILGDAPVTGDWNADGITEIGVFRPSTHIYYRDYNGNGIWDGPVIDRASNFGISSDIAVSGDWNGDRITEIGVYRPSTHLYYRDLNGNALWDGPIIDRFSSFGITGDIPLAGDWNADGITEIGVFRPSNHIFYMDYNGNGLWDGTIVDRINNFGITGDIPITGDWNMDGGTEIGIFRPSVHLFYLDFNGNGLWDGAAIDRVNNFGITEDIPISGKWG